jgi:hypothetical protein
MHCYPSNNEAGRRYFCPVLITLRHAGCAEFQLPSWMHPTAMPILCRVVQLLISGSLRQVRSESMDTIYVDLLRLWRARNARYAKRQGRGSIIQPYFDHQTRLLSHIQP